MMMVVSKVASMVELTVSKLVVCSGVQTAVDLVADSAAERATRTGAC